MNTKQTLIQRHSYFERVGHWLAVAGFFFIAVSGLGFAFPSLRWMTGVLGTPQLAQFLHPVFGLIMLVGVLMLFIANIRHECFNKDDVQWVAHMKEVVSGHEHEVVEVGQYNAGQKGLFWVIVLLFVVLLLTGLAIWRPYFAPNFSPDTLRWCLFLHSLCGILLMIAIIVHAYMAFWYKGTLRGMVTGKVERRWAKMHHPKWLREVEKR